MAQCFRNYEFPDMLISTDSIFNKNPFVQRRIFQKFNLQEDLFFKNAARTKRKKVPKKLFPEKAMCSEIGFKKEIT